MTDETKPTLTDQEVADGWRLMRLGSGPWQKISPDTKLASDYLKEHRDRVAADRADVKLSLPDKFESLCRADPRAAYDLLVAHLATRLPYRVDRGTFDAIKLAMQIAWTLGQRDGIRAVIEDIAGNQAKEPERHDH
jgi:hypothetical protein